jgi:hypothetical protein
MMKNLSLLAFTAALLLPAANAHAATVNIGGTGLTLVYNTADGTLCDVGGCATYFDTSNFGDTDTLVSLDFAIDGLPAGGLDNPPTDIYMDVYLTGIQLTPGGGLQVDNTGISGFVDFYTVGADGFDSLLLNVNSAGIVYSLSGLSVNVTSADINVFASALSYSFGNFAFADPDVSWSFDASSSTTTQTGFTTLGTPNWEDLSVEFDTPVPEPGSMLLLGSGLMGLAASARRRLRRKDQ